MTKEEFEKKADEVGKEITQRIIKADHPMTEDEIYELIKEGYKAITGKEPTFKLDQ